MTETKDTTDGNNSQDMSASDITPIIKPPEKSQEIQFLEKMSRTQYECTDCKERFSSTESLKSHSHTHLNGEGKNVPLKQSENKANQKGCNDSPYAYLHDKFPAVFSKRILIKIEKVDATEIGKKASSCNGSGEARERIKTVNGNSTARDKKGMYFRNI